MILDGFRKVNIRKRIKKELLRSNSLNTGINQKIDTVLILIDKNYQENLGKIIAKKVNIDVLNVTTIFFKSKQDSDTNFEYKLTEKDFSLFGKLKNKAIEKWIKSDFDLLLNYTKENQYLNFVTAFSKAKFKVGLKYNQQENFDLIIDVEKEKVDLFHNELVKYLKILNKI